MSVKASTLDLNAAQTRINEMEGSENPPANLSQLFKGVATHLGLPNPNVLLYHVKKGNLAVKTVVRPKSKSVKVAVPAVDKAPRFVVVETSNNVAVKVTAFPTKEKAVETVSGMLLDVRSALESSGNYSLGNGTTFSVVELS